MEEDTSRMEDSRQSVSDDAGAETEASEETDVYDRLQVPDKLVKYGAAAGAAVAIAIGAFALGNAGSGDSSTSAALPAGAAGQPPTGAQQGVPPTGAQQGVPPTGAQQGAPGGAQQGALPGGATEVTGDAADKVEKAALAEYDGTVERVVELPDGSYVAHVITDDGEAHVAVSSDFEVTGEVPGPPAAQGAAPGAGASAAPGAVPSTTS